MGSKNDPAMVAVYQKYFALGLTGSFGDFVIVRDEQGTIGLRERERKTRIVVEYVSADGSTMPLDHHQVACAAFKRPRG